MVKSRTENAFTPKATSMLARAICAFALAFTCAAAIGAPTALADEQGSLRTGSTAADLSAQVDAETTSTLTIEATYGQTEARSMLAMINEFRTGKDAWAWNEAGAKESYTGLSELSYDYELERVAMQRAAELALSFSHTRPDGSTMSNSMISGNMAWGENIAAGYASAYSVFTGWREDDQKYDGQGHRRNMLSKNFTSVGIGHAVCDGYHYWVQVFGAPQLDATETPAVDEQRSVEVQVANGNIKKRWAVAEPSEISLAMGKSVALPSVTAKIDMSDAFQASGVAVKTSLSAWKSSDTSVVAISGGRVIAVAPGEAQLTVSVDLGKTVTVSVPVKVAKRSIADTTIGSISNVSFTGTAHKPLPIVKYDGKLLVLDRDYTLSYSNNIKAGTATAVVKGIGEYTGSKSMNFTISKAANPLIVKVAKKKLTVKRGKAKVFKTAQAFKVSSPEGTVTFAKASKVGGKKIIVAKNGKVTIKKGLKGNKTYKVKVKVKAAGNGNYLKATGYVTLVIRVK